MICIEQQAYKEARHFVKAAKALKWGLNCFYQTVLVLLENIIKYHFVHKSEYLANCKWAVKNFALLGMPEYGGQAELFINQNQNTCLLKIS